MRIAALLALLIIVALPLSADDAADFLKAVSGSDLAVVRSMLARNPALANAHSPKGTSAVTVASGSADSDPAATTVAVLLIFDLMNPARTVSLVFWKLSSTLPVSSGSTIATANDRLAFAAYLPRGRRLALEKSTSVISRSERLLGSVSFDIGSPLALCRSPRADDSNLLSAFEMNDEKKTSEAREA